jgi:hypothetical protein
VFPGPSLEKKKKAEFLLKKIDELISLGSTWRRVYFGLVSRRTVIRNFAPEPKSSVLFVTVINAFRVFFS